MALLLAAVTASPQDVSVNAWVDTNKILIGDQLFYNVEVKQPAGKELAISQLRDTLIQNIDILKFIGPDTITSDSGMLKISSRYLITSFDSGAYDIPPYYVELSDSGKIVRFYSDYTHLDVMRTNVAPTDSTDVIFDIAAPYHESVSFKELMPWIVGIIFLILVAYLIIRRIKSRKQKTRPEDLTRIPGEPINITILKELDKLERKKHIEKGEIKQFYISLTEILRKYIFLRYNIFSFEMTTSETLSSLISSGFVKDANFSRLENIFTTADFVKFAKYIPPTEVSSEMIDNSRLFVREDTKRFKPAENAGELKKENKEGEAGDE
jgi:hypothetical protein